MIDAITPIQPISVYYENRISYDEKWGRTVSITEIPHVTYDKSGRLIVVPDQSFNLGAKYV